MGLFQNLFGSRPPVIPAQHRREVDQLIEELLEIGRKQDFLSERPGGEFTAQCHNIRARAIARRLNEIAGIDLMRFAHARVRRKLGSNLAAHLEYAWDEIGEWVA